MQHVDDDSDDAAQIWQLCCSLLHQGRTQDGRGSSIAFAEPGSGLLIHRSVLQSTNDGHSVIWYGIQPFVAEVAAGVRQWLEQFGDTARESRNLTKFARRRPEGLPGLVEGAAVIS